MNPTPTTLNSCFFALILLHSKAATGLRIINTAMLGDHYIALPGALETDTTRRWVCVGSLTHPPPEQQRAPPQR